MIPFLDLRLQQAALEPDMLAAAGEVIASGRYTLGPHTAAFEAAFADLCGCGYSVAVSSGTAALHLALLAAGVEPGDEVITTPATFVGTVAAIQLAGAIPRLVDIDPATWTLDPAGLEAAITPRTRAIIPVHLHGRMADMPAILAIARARGLVVIEDAAQAHGAELGGRPAGSHGDLGCFSFYPGKNLGACGEGGAVTTNRPDLAERLKLLRDWGQPRKYVHAIKGFNCRMDEIQAALLNVKLPQLARWTRMRRNAAERYDRALDAAGIRHALPLEPRGHVYHVYAVRIAGREAVRSRMAAEVETNIHYPTPVHLQPAYADLGYGPGDFPVAEAFAAETLSLPVFPGLTEAQIDLVANRLIDACQATGPAGAEAA